MAYGSVGTDIQKGTILKFTGDPNVAAASSSDFPIFAGILAEENVGGDGQTEFAVWTEGVFAMKISAGGTVVLGQFVKIDGANLINFADDDTIEQAGQIVGRGLETGGNNEVIQVSLGRT